MNYYRWGAVLTFDCRADRYWNSPAYHPEFRTETPTAVTTDTTGNQYEH